MRKGLIAACVLSSFTAGQAWSMQWVNTGSHDAQWKYLSDSAYVDKTTGLIHVEICSGAPGCRDATVTKVEDTVYVTDAVIDCKNKTITWRDNFEAINIDTVVVAKHAAPSHAKSASPFDRLRRNPVAPASDAGHVVGMVCAQTAMLPKRLPPGVPGAGLVLRFEEDYDPRGPQPLPGEELAHLPGGASVWVRPGADMGRDLLEGAVASPAADASGHAGIILTLTDDGARLMSGHVQDVGNKVAIAVDGDVLVEGKIEAPVTGRTVRIDGEFTPKQAAALARSIAVWTAHTPMTE